MSKIRARAGRKSAQGNKARATGGQLVVLPERRRTWLLASTAIFAGALAGSIGLSDKALADCTDVGPGDSFVCDGDPAEGSFTFAPDQDLWTGTLLSAANAAPDPAAALTGTLTINNSNGFNGLVTFQDGSSISTDGTDGSHGFVLNDSSPSTLKLVTINMDGASFINARDNATDNADGMRLQGYNLKVNLNDTSSVTGDDDGIVIREAWNRVEITIGADASVTGAGERSDNDPSNGGDGILAAKGNGTATIANAIEGSILINAYGDVTGDQANLAGDTSPWQTGGAAMNLAAKQSIEVNIYESSNVSGTSGLYATSNAGIQGMNWGSITTTSTSGAGMWADSYGTDPTEAVVLGNYSLESITGEGAGLIARSFGGAPIFLYNGGNDNPDGLIDVKQFGVFAESWHGGPIEIWNGDGSHLQSQIYSGGGNGFDDAPSEGYAVYARSHADIADGLSDKNHVSFYNFGHVELWGEGDAAVYARASGDLDGFAAVYNGGVCMGEGCGPTNYNARINAYGVTTGTEAELVAYDEYWYPTSAPTVPLSQALIHDANGIELVKRGSGGSLEVYGIDFGLFATNYGMWDFNRPDNYLTPGWDGDYYVGTPSVVGVEGYDPHGYSGGIYAPGGSAVLVRYNDNYNDEVFHTDPDNFGFWNNGTVIGQGSRHDPVMDIFVAYVPGTDVMLQGTGDFNINYSGNASLVYNGSWGVMGSENTPYGWENFSLGDLTYFASDLIGGALSWGDIEDRFLGYGGLREFAEAAGDHLAHVEGAPYIAYNDGLQIGRLKLKTEASNFIYNQGAWFVTGKNEFFGDAYDTYVNGAKGWIQAAFDPYENERTNFKSLNYTYNAGVVSLLDGAAGDKLTFGGNYQGGYEYTGSIGSGIEIPYSHYDEGYFALDAYLAGWDYGYADRFKIKGDAYGSTGLIIRDSNKYGDYKGIVDHGIKVVKVEGWHEGCYDYFCKSGDTFYIAPQSKNYLESLDGTGLLGDGLYAWGLKNPEWHNGEYYKLVNFFGPGAFNSAGIIGGARNIWYETLSIVDRWNYAMQFGAAGGGGADLPAADYTAPASSSAPNTGLWVKGSGSWVETDTTLNQMGLDFDTSYQQDIYSILAGADFKPGNSDSPYRFGVFGGYVTSGLDFAGGLPGSSVEYEGGEVGGYAAYNNGAFYVDATVKGDILDATYDMGGGTEVDTNVWSAGVAANTGYRMSMGAGFFEPIASLSYVHTEVDNFTGGGGTVNFSNGESLRAGGGARIGAVMPTAGGSVEVSLLGKLWNEFEGDNTITVTDGGTTETFSDDTSGLIGEAEATIGWTNATGSLSTFLSGGGKFGESFTSWNAQAGVRAGF